MAKDSDPDSRPISVEELIARTKGVKQSERPSAGTSGQGGPESFPRSGSVSASRAADGDSSARTASGMPSYRAAKRSPASSVGASGMPSYEPSAGSPKKRSSNEVTGIIPVVDDDDVDTGELVALRADDLVGEELPTADASLTPVTKAQSKKSQTSKSKVGSGSFLDDDEGADHMASAADLEVAERENEREDDEDREEPSVLRQWLGLVGEVVLGVVVGAGLFWGFTELWKRYVYLALILAIVVIFAIVTFSYVLRKRDLATTLFALAVGLLVTIGPLVMLI